MNKIELKDAQKVCAGASERLTKMLMGWSPAQELKVGDLHSIADFVRNAVFTELEGRDLINK